MDDHSHFAPPPSLLGDEDGSSSERGGAAARAAAWARSRLRGGGGGAAAAAPAPPAAAGYVTLVPEAAAARGAAPRSARAACAQLLAAAAAAAAAAFLLLPRPLSVGEVTVEATRVAWNTSSASYQLGLVATLPVVNPNYASALGALGGPLLRGVTTIEGDLRVLFYRTEAGSARVERTAVPLARAPRGWPLRVAIDAGRVPDEYILAILAQCGTFPQTLVFFLRGRLTARHLFQTQRLATIDTYFLIDCNAAAAGGVAGGGVGGAGVGGGASGGGAAEFTGAGAARAAPQPVEAAAAAGPGRRAGPRVT